MTEVRRSIEYVRHNWNRYGELMVSLQALMAEQGLVWDRDDELGRRASALFASQKDWIDRRAAEHGNALAYDAIRLYTSDQGYRHIFSVINSIFRSEGSTNFERLVVSAVFLVELLNIDLYNYWWSHPNAKDFEGVLYRGMCITENDFHAFSQILQQPLSERYISVPLGLVSTSVRSAEAEFFLKTRLREDPSQIPLLWRINVVGLGAHLLGSYQNRFPQSVVSTICAVPVSQLSDFPHEQEVLLRGPFFQVLNFFEGGEIEGKPVYVLEVVILNSNRDHFTTAQLGKNDRPARELFGAIVNLRRSQFCLEYCEKHNLHDDAVAYRTQYEIFEKRM
jgi:hypothetical protein